MSVYKLRKAIDERLRQSQGIGYAGVILGVALAGFVLFPITKWFLNINSGTNDLSKKLEMQSVIQDYWQSLNAMTYDEFEAAVASRGTTFSEDIGNWKVTTTFSAKGKYANSTCSPGTTPTADDRSCRRATITIQNKNDTLQSTKLDTTKVSSQSDKRIRDLEDAMSSMKTRVTNAENKFSNYYTKSQVDSKDTTISNKFGSYYTSAQTDAKISAMTAGQSLWIDGKVCGKRITYSTISTPSGWTQSFVYKGQRYVRPRASETHVLRECGGCPGVGVLCGAMNNSSGPSSTVHADTATGFYAFKVKQYSCYTSGWGAVIGSEQYFDYRTLNINDFTTDYGCQSD